MNISNLQMTTTGGGKFLTEDIVRDKARQILGLNDSRSVQAGTGQLTSFHQLGFIGVQDRPDGWYLPNEPHLPAIILETKNSKIAFKHKEVAELLKNCNIVAKRYKNVIGILYNGYDVQVYKNGELQEGEIELQSKDYYLSLFKANRINKQEIYASTKIINDLLHFDLGLKDLYMRMIFTACTLVAKKSGAEIDGINNYEVLRAAIKSRLTSVLDGDLVVNRKLQYLLDIFNSIELNNPNNVEAIKRFIAEVNKIAKHIESDFWNGEDVMAIFFNEFNRYKKKSESGQVFTPDHITSLMYRILDVNINDRVLDAACGSGAFLVKAMCNMIKAAGGNSSPKAKEIKQSQLYGIEFDKVIFALACANMLIHKDGKTNIAHLDSRTSEAFEWIRNKHITKVLMNPPFEQKYGCLDIVENVLDAVSEPELANMPKRNIPCAFILPDDKLEKRKNQTIRILRKHSLVKIIKLPEKLFGNGIKTSIYIFQSGIPQNRQQNKNVLGYYIQDDGFETVKNQGRHDIFEKWQEIEDYWVDVILKQCVDKDYTQKWINLEEELRYSLPDREFQIDATDFKKTVLEYVLFNSQIDATDFKIVIQNVNN